MKKILLFLILFLPLKLFAQDVIVIDPGTFGGGIMNIDPWLSLDPLLDSVQNWIWVSKDNQTGRETGTYMLPYNTIAEGLAVAPTGSLVIVVTPADASAYEISDELVIPNNNVILTGQGSSTVIDGDGLSTNEHAISIAGKTGCAIINLSIQTEDGGDKTCHCIMLNDGANGTIIKNVTIINSDDDGIHIEGTTTSGVTVQDCNILGTDGDGISVDMDAAKGQLASSTMLQMAVEPDIVHVVAYCEADHAATPKDVIESCKIVRQVIENAQKGLPDMINDNEINERRNFLITESEFLISFIKRLSRNADRDPLTDSDNLSLALKIGILDAPHLSGSQFALGKIKTRIINGACCTFDTLSKKIINSEERLSMLSGLNFSRDRSNRVD